MCIDARWESKVSKVMHECSVSWEGASRRVFAGNIYSPSVAPPHAHCALEFLEPGMLSFGPRNKAQTAYFSGSRRTQVSPILIRKDLSDPPDRPARSPHHHPGPTPKNKAHATISPLLLVVHAPAEPPLRLAMKVLHSRS